MVGNRKAETPAHSILKHLTASILERMGHKVSIEFELPGVGIIDVMDHTDSFAYEIQSGMSESIKKEKVDQYLRCSQIKDVIFIPITCFPMAGIMNSKTYHKLKYKLGMV